MIVTYVWESTKHIHVTLQEQGSDCKCISKKTLFPANSNKSLAEIQFPALVH